MDMKLKSRAGFTLLELLMVVIIVGILVSIALPQFLRAAERSRASEALSILGAVRASQNRYLAFDNNTPPSYADTNNPAGLCALDIDTPGCTDPQGNLIAVNNWTFAAPTAPCSAGVGCDVVATRVGGVAAGGTIQIDLDTGLTCADTAANSAIWGVGAPGC